MSKGRHGQHDLTFEELDFAGQARSINGQIRSLEQAIYAHVRRSQYEIDKNETVTLTKCVHQLSSLVERLLRLPLLKQQEQEVIKNRQLQYLERGFNLGKKLYSTREDLYAR